MAILRLSDGRCRGGLCPHGGLWGNILKFNKGLSLNDLWGEECRGRLHLHMEMRKDKTAGFVLQLTLMLEVW